MLCLIPKSKRRGTLGNKGALTHHLRQCVYKQRRHDRSHAVPMKDLLLFYVCRPFCLRIFGQPFAIQCIGNHDSVRPHSPTNASRFSRQILL